MALPWTPQFVFSMVENNSSLRSSTQNTTHSHNRPHKQIADLVKHSMQMQNWQVHADFHGGIKGFDATEP